VFVTGSAGAGKTTHRIGWLLALRPGEVADEAREAVDRLEAGASEIRLGPLDETAVAQVAWDMLGGDPDEALREVLRRADGQPFLLTELLRGLRAESLVAVDGSTAKLAVGVQRAGGRPDPAAEQWPQLTASELAVVRLVTQGATDREVAERLYISAHTVNSHLRHIFAKLGIRSRVELARLAGERQPP
jgi:DNA-binding CsgD family transcriptional regulator